MVLFMTGPLAGISGGDVHALRMAQFCSADGLVDVIAPTIVSKIIPDNFGIQILSPKILWEEHFSNLVANSLYMIARAFRYSLKAPSAEVAIAASHLTPDVFCCTLHHVLRRSQMVVYVHHLVTLAGRHDSIRSRISKMLESTSLYLARRFSAIIFTVDSSVQPELIRRGFHTDLVHLTENAYEPLVEMPKRTNDPKHPTVVYCGRLSEEKGIWDVLAVAQRLRDSVPSARIEMMGDGPMKSALIERISSEKIFNVRVRGFVSENEKWSLLRGADVFLAPSYEEGWGIAVGEALTAGLPTVAYALPAYRQFGDALVKVPIGDTSALGHAVVDLIVNLESKEAVMAQLANLAPLSWESILRKERLVIQDAVRSEGQ